MTREVEPRHDTTGKLISLHDVLIDDETGEMAIVVYATNKSGVYGLAVEIEETGGDWLDVYPDGVWTILGNMAIMEGELNV